MKIENTRSRWKYAFFELSTTTAIFQILKRFWQNFERTNIAAKKDLVRSFFPWFYLTVQSLLHSKTAIIHKWTIVHNCTVDCHWNAIWDKVFKNGPSKIFERQSSANSKAVFHEVFKNGPSKTFQRLSSINFSWSILEYRDPFNICVKKEW